MSVHPTTLQEFVTLSTRIKTSVGCLIFYMILIAVTLVLTITEWSNPEFVNHNAVIVLEAIINSALIAEVTTSILAAGLDYFNYLFNIIDLILTIVCSIFFIIFLSKLAANDSTESEGISLELDGIFLILRYIVQFTRMILLFYRGRKTHEMVEQEDVDFSTIMHRTTNRTVVAADDPDDMHTIIDMDAHDSQFNSPITAVNDGRANEIPDIGTSKRKNRTNYKESERAPKTKKTRDLVNEVQLLLRRETTASSWDGDQTNVQTSANTRTNNISSSFSDSEILSAANADAIESDAVANTDMEPGYRRPLSANALMSPATKTAVINSIGRTPLPVILAPPPDLSTMNFVINDEDDEDANFNGL